MNVTKVHWMIAGVGAIIGALVALVAVEYLHQSGSGAAYAQTGEAAASANYVLALMGNTTNQATPIVLIDTKTQTLLVYEYMIDRHTMFLRNARTYAADRELLDNAFWAGDSYSGPSVNDVRNLARTRR